MLILICIKSFRAFHFWFSSVQHNTDLTLRILEFIYKENANGVLRQIVHRLYQGIFNLLKRKYVKHVRGQVTSLFP